MLALRRGMLHIVRLLGEKGADVNLPDASGNTPVLFSASSGHLSALCLLTEKGKLS